MTHYPTRKGLKTMTGEPFPPDGLAINPHARFYARMIADGDLTDVAPKSDPAPVADKSAAKGGAK